MTFFPLVVKTFILVCGLHSLFRALHSDTADRTTVRSGASAQLELASASFGVTLIEKCENDFGLYSVEVLTSLQRIKKSLGICAWSLIILYIIVSLALPLLCCSSVGRSSILETLEYLA